MQWLFLIWWWPKRWWCKLQSPTRALERFDDNIYWQTGKVRQTEGWRNQDPHKKSGFWQKPCSHLDSRETKAHYSINYCPTSQQKCLNELTKAVKQHLYTCISPSMTMQQQCVCNSMLWRLPLTSALYRGYLLTAVNTYKSSGCDGISGKILKSTANSITYQPWLPYLVMFEYNTTTHSLWIYRCKI